MIAPTRTEAPNADAAVPGVLQRVFSFPVAMAGLFLVLTVLTLRSRFDDPDMWWHLKTGQVIWTSHSIPTTDLFSFTTNHHAYVPHEWLAQLLIFAAYHFGGYSGLMLWLCFFTAAILIAGYALCSLYSGNVKVAFLGAFTIWLFGTSGFAVRPQVVGYLFMVLELILLQLGRTRSPRWFFALPPLFALWVNCHGSFFLGLVAAAVMLFSSYFSFQIGSLEASRWEPAQRRTLAIALLLSACALFLNPGGIRTIEYPLNMMFVQSVATGNITEWLPLQFTDLRGFALMVVIATIFLAVIAHRAQLLWHELLLLALGTWLAASHRRLVFPFGILAAPILSRILADSWDHYEAAHDRPLPNAILFIASLLLAIRVFPSPQDLARQVEQRSPVKAVEFIHAQHLAGPMLNDFADGGYLIWAAPDHPVFIDGRADVFEWTGVLAEYGNWATLQSPPAALPDKYGVNFCILPRSSYMATVMPLLPNWKVAYSDALSVVLVRVPANNTAS